MQILNISKLRNGIGILKKQENITENLTAEENRKEIKETMENAAAEKKPARRPARKNTTARKKKTDEAAGKEEKADSKGMYQGRERRPYHRCQHSCKGNNHWHNN